MSALVFQGYGPDGSSLDPMPSWGYLSDTDFEPFPAEAKVQGSTLRVTTAPGKRFYLDWLWEVPDFGRVVVRADNAGEGYQCPADGEESLNLNYEFARSRLAAVERRVAQVHDDGALVTGELAARRAEAQEMVKAAEAAADEGERARLATKALTAAMWAGEMLELAKARADVERLAPREAFLFGANAFGLGQGEDYTRLFEELLNFGTVPFYWGSFEPEEGRPDYRRADAITNWLTGAGLTAKGHPLVWFFPQITPKWQHGKSYEEMKQLCVERVRTIVSRYRGKIDIWDIINEAHDWANVFGYSHEQMIEVVRAISDAAKEANPDCVRIVNNCCLWAEYVATRKTMQGIEDRELWSPYRFMAALNEAGVDYEVIGLQVYYPMRDMFEISRLLDMFGQLGKPIHITELGVPSRYEGDPKSYFKDEDAVKNMGWWHAPWTQTIQADWIEQFYTICYSKPGGRRSRPQIEAITWWDFSDHGGHFWPWGGFVDEDLQPKESYRRLKALLAKWRGD